MVRSPKRATQYNLDSWDDEIIIRSLYSTGNIVKVCEIDGMVINAVVDTGATVSLVSTETFERMENPPNVQKIVTMKTASENLSFSGKLLEPVQIQIDSVKLLWPLYVAPISDPMLLGLDLLKEIKANIDCENDKIIIANNQFVSSPQKDDQPAEIDLYLDSAVKIPSLTEVVVKLGRKLRQQGVWYLEPNPDMPVMVARSLHSNKGAIAVSIVNLNENHITLPKNTFLGVLYLTETQIIKKISNVNKESNSKNHEHIKEMTAKAQKAMKSYQVSEANQKQFVDLMIEFSDVFAKHDLDLGNFTALEHSIDTGDAKPQVTKMRRCPVHFVDEEQKHLEDMIKADVVQPSCSAWAAAPVLVRKRDGSLRWCIDYRQVNSVTTKDTFPLPFLGECLDCLEGNNWFSQLDSNSAYWQVPVAESSRPKTAFRTRHGLYEFKKLPFGLTNSPATFGRVMQLVLRGLTWQSALSFLDDVLVIGKTVEDHLVNLRLVLSRFREYKLKLKPRKCVFFEKTVEFLGRTVSRNGVTLTESSKETMDRWETPKSIKDMQRLLGFINYHRNYIPNLSLIEEPLQEITRKKKFYWTDKQQAAFEEVKKNIASPAVLAIPTKTGRFYLETDASDYSIGGHLLQDQDGEKRTISFGSFTLNKAQKNYCTTKRVLLSIVRCTDITYWVKSLQ